jgi:hypothetical protein
MNTYASNPGKIRVNYWRLIRHKPFWSLAIGVGTIGMFVFGALKGDAGAVNLAMLVLVFFLAYRLLHVWGLSRHFQVGDVNVSKVLSLNPPLFATSTDMQTGRDNMQYPAVKIVRGKVANARGMKWKVGDRFAAACMYSGALGSRHWTDFEPLPLSMATDDAEVLQEHMRRLEHLFEELDLRLLLVPDVRKPGLYFLDAARLASLRSNRSHGTA